MHCEKYGAAWDEPYLSPALLQEIKSLRRSNRTLAAAQRLRHAGAVVKDAKAIAVHITLEPGKCHRCGMRLTISRNCPNCRSFNYDW